ncbi:MAG: glycosyltransferase family 2 protein [Deltaproteobacteria bacterium]|nr:glycosyltransferase family 2 protein [Deltaproteobacteria bacterium]
MTTIDIAIPVLNEEHYISGCLDSVLAFELPEHVCSTIYVLDGGSLDHTRSVVKDYSQRFSKIVLLDNPGRIQSCALNIVIRQGKGDYILRLDAHSFYPRDYLRLCLETAKRTGGDNVGGVVITKPGNFGYAARVVQALTTHSFGVGNSGFRLDSSEKAVDTVPFGFFKREIFDRIGLYDERLVRAQDYEINRRIIAAGGKVWLNPNIRVYYHNQPGLYSFYKKQITKEAPYNAYLWWVAPYAFAPRHAITGLFSAGILSGLVLWSLIPWVQLPFLAVMMLYGILAISSAFQQAKRYREPLHLLSLPVCFFMYHFLHGFGVLWGLIRIATRTSPVQRIKEPWPGAGRYRAWPQM